MWQNGRAAVKIQGEPGSLQLVLFDMDEKHRLKFKEELVMREEEALNFLSGHNCQLTNKKLVVV